MSRADRAASRIERLANRMMRRGDVLHYVSALAWTTATSIWLGGPTWGLRVAAVPTACLGVFFAVVLPRRFRRFPSTAWSEPR